MKSSKLTNILMVIVSTFLTLMAIEVVIEKALLAKIPIKFHFALPSALEVLAQSSKAQRIPKQYIALVGDSYAQGRGDWLLQIDPGKNTAFHSAHVLQELTHHDVITFGKSGASSIKGWVSEPESKYNYIHDAIDNQIQSPDFILAFFYAGNDLSDNLMEVRDSFFPEYGETALHDDTTWNIYFNKQVRKNKVGPYGSAYFNHGWIVPALFEIIKEELKFSDSDAEGRIKKERVAATTNPNQAMIGGHLITIPGNLQSPGLELNAQQTKIALLAMSKSLARLKKAFPVSHVVLVYVPSVIESYTLSSAVSVRNAIRQRQGEYQSEQHSAAEITSRSDEIAAIIAAEAKTQGVPFIDTRSAIRAASAQHTIHGPQDWDHFNRLGYEALARSIACGMAMNKLWPPTVCPQ